MSQDVLIAIGILTVVMIKTYVFLSFISFIARRSNR